MEIIVDGKTETLIGTNGHCPICDTPRNQMNFDWTLHHGIATSSCCGSTYIIERFHVEKPTQEMKNFMALIDTGKWIALCVNQNWIEPIRAAMKCLNKTRIDKDVIDLAKTYLQTNQEKK